MGEQDILSERRVGELRVVAIESAELTAGVAEVLAAKVKELAAGEPAKIVLDLGNVKFIDSVALGGLVVLLRRVKQAKGRLALACLSGHCLKVMEATGLGKLFELYDDVPTAAEVLQRPS